MCSAGCGSTSGHSRPTLLIPIVGWDDDKGVSVEQPKPDAEKTSSLSPGLEKNDVKSSPEPVSNATPRTNGEPMRRPVPLNPRRVRGGVRLKPQDEKDTPHWVTDRIWRLVERAVSAEVYAEGLEYARLGQTRRVEFEDGQVEASVQGRMSRPYPVKLRLSHFSSEDRDRIIDAMADQALYAAKLLAREVPTNIEDLFAPLGLKLFPSDPEEIETSCSCKEPKPWCKHAVCAAILVAQKLGREPLSIFELRGQSIEQFIAMLSDRRALNNQGPGPTLVYQPQIPGVSDRSASAMTSDLENFWEPGGPLDEIDAPLGQPAVSHVLLRRLGPSPFTESRFPLVGLMATCYELTSEHARREADGVGDLDEETPDSKGNDGVTGKD